MLMPLDRADIIPYNARNNANMSQLPNREGEMEGAGRGSGAIVVAQYIDDDDFNDEPGPDDFLEEPRRANANISIVNAGKRAKAKLLEKRPVAPNVPLAKDIELVEKREKAQKRKDKAKNKQSKKDVAAAKQIAKNAKFWTRFRKTPPQKRPYSEDTTPVPTPHY